MTDAPICKDCRWFEARWLGDYCLSPKAGPDRVRGGATATKCGWQRSWLGNCGGSARWFEKRGVGNDMAIGRPEPFTL